MRRRARVWLAERAGPVPPALQAAMESAADAVDAGDAGECDSLPAALAHAALRKVADALRLGDDRDAALALLAADALVTFSCEAAAHAEGGADAALADLCETFAPARLDGLLPERST